MTENHIMVYNNVEFGEIRTLNIDGEPWFVGKDVADILKYKNTKDAISTHVDEEDKRIIQRSENTTFEIPTRGLTIINESGLYSLILSSHLPNAKKFKHWITSEVIPSIRKTGGYIEKDSAMYNYIKSLEQSISVLQSFNSSLANQMEELKAKVSEIVPVLNRKKINIWKYKFIKPNIDMLVHKYGIDERSAYDLVYDRMSSRYGFDRSCAMDEFCDKYKRELCYVTDAIADYEPYRRYFVDCVYELLGLEDPELKNKDFSQPVYNGANKVEYKDDIENSFNEIVDSLETQNKNNQNRGIGTLGKIYKAMMPDSDWKQIMLREHCYSKKQLILNDEKLFDCFKSTVSDMLGGSVV